MKFNDKENIVPNWLRETVHQNSIDKIASEVERRSLAKDSTFTIVDPDTIGQDKEKKITINLYIDEDKIDDSGSETYAVSVYWSDSNNNIYVKKFTSEDEAQNDYLEKVKLFIHINGLLMSENVSEEQKQEAEKLSIEALNKLKNDSGTIVDVIPPISTTQLSSSLKNFREGVDLKKLGEKVGIEFDDTFIMKDLLGVRVLANDIDVVNEPTEVFSTFGKNHVGLNDYTLSYYKKAELSNGNLNRDLIKVEKGLNRVCIAECHSKDNFDIVCNKLTPLASEYNLSFDSKKQAWLTKEAAEETLPTDTPKTDKPLAIRYKDKEGKDVEAFFSTVEEMITFQKELNGEGITVEEPKKEEGLPPVEPPVEGLPKETPPPTDAEIDKLLSEMPPANPEQMAKSSSVEKKAMTEDEEFKNAVENISESDPFKTPFTLGDILKSKNLEYKPKKLDYNPLTQGTAPKSDYKKKEVKIIFPDKAKVTPEEWNKFVNTPLVRPAGMSEEVFKEYVEDKEDYVATADDFIQIDKDVAESNKLPLGSDGKRPLPKGWEFYKPEETVSKEATLDNYIGIKKTENEPWSIVYSKYTFRDAIRKEAELKEQGYITKITKDPSEVIDVQVSSRDFSEQTTK